MERNKIRLYSEYIIHPGEILKDLIDDRGISQKELSENTGYTDSFISNILNGKEPISISFALSLLDISKEFWLNLQKNYEDELKQLQIRDSY